MAGSDIGDITFDGNYHFMDGVKLHGIVQCSILPPENMDNPFLLCMETTYNDY